MSTSKFIKSWELRGAKLFYQRNIVNPNGQIYFLDSDARYERQLEEAREEGLLMLEGHDFFMRESTYGPELLLRIKVPLYHTGVVDKEKHPPIPVWELFPPQTFSQVDLFSVDEAGTEFAARGFMMFRDNVFFYKSLPQKEYYFYHVKTDGRVIKKLKWPSVANNQRYYRAVLDCIFREGCIPAFPS